MDRTLFDPIIGHSRLKEQFARLIDEDRIPHAMIFAGPAGIGKTLMAIVNLPPRKMMGLESNGMLISAVHTEHGEEQLHLVMLDDAIPAGAKMC